MLAFWLAVLLCMETVDQTDPVCLLALLRVVSAFAVSGYCHVPYEAVVMAEDCVVQSRVIALE